MRNVKYRFLKLFYFTISFYLLLIISGSTLCFADVNNNSQSQNAFLCTAREFINQIDSVAQLSAPDAKLVTTYADYVTAKGLARKWEYNYYSTIEKKLYKYSIMDSVLSIEDPISIDYST